MTARDDVPFFGPPLPDPAVFRKVRGSPQPRSWTEQNEMGGDWEGRTVCPKRS